MTTTINNTPDLASRFINGILAIKPLANLAKHQARQMMIKRAEKIGVPWTQEVEKLQQRDWVKDLSKVENPQIQINYPEYYLRTFHAYEQGNLGWPAAFELEVAARTVHASIWTEAGSQGDTKLRQSYHNILKEKIDPQPQNILDLGCAVGLSTFALQSAYPQAKITGLDLSPYFLAVANYRSQEHQTQINWVHAQAESTGFTDATFDLVSIFLMCHELPQSATYRIFTEARRILRPGGHLAIMDINPKAENYKKMPPYILTLLKSTEPYLDEYFSLDIEQALIKTGFNAPTITSNSPRHRTVIAQVSG
ncbi:class I SAM-dependent methyltransferase [Dolichospermum circinale]|uniref:class I SAM-dependent methyltransferase n=1 Tax=Dolichospermum circinale TaxID=109265 RepID=UPI00232AE4D7|nr:class I SAM-dependent methyltransferase [Dolichospermum circinale]MDB9458571.1 class I SAM-dependent methyltransferase [Dolichospermum circinale CS-545/17]MDB9465569.1 class I SAM-dependent methyltransferase [Dolichospermum circinale CS-539/09]MDB9472573.1 class I SAM-dependent methyltransferase [Dolichospermum circinale CS-539]